MSRTHERDRQRDGREARSGQRGCGESRRRGLKSTGGAVVEPFGAPISRHCFRSPKPTAAAEGAVAGREWRLGHPTLSIADNDAQSRARADRHRRATDEFSTSRALGSTFRGSYSRRARSAADLSGPGPVVPLNEAVSDRTP